MAKFASTHPMAEASWPWTVPIYRTRWGDLLAHVLIEFTLMSAAVLLILAVGGVAGVYWALPALDAQSRAFANAEVAAVAPTWDESALMASATPRLLASSYGGYDYYFASLQRLGVGARNQGCVGRAAIHPTSVVSLVTPRFVRRFVTPPPFSGLVTANYACELKTSTGQAMAMVTLRRDQDAWRVAGFYVASPRLARD